MNTYTFEGKKYALTSEAEPSCRLFAGCFQEAHEGESYTDEWKANGTDEEGNSVDVYFQFTQVKGQEPEEADALPWDDEHISQVIPQ